MPAGWKAQKARIGVSECAVQTEGELARFTLTPATSEPMFWTIAFQKP